MINRRSGLFIANSVCILGIIVLSLSLLFHYKIDKPFRSKRIPDFNIRFAGVSFNHRPHFHYEQAMYSFRPESTGMILCVVLDGNSSGSAHSWYPTKDYREYYCEWWGLDEWTDYIDRAQP